MQRQPAGQLRRKPRLDLFGGKRFGQFELHHFVVAGNAHRKRQREGHPRFGMKTFAPAQGQFRAAENPFETAHQVAMPDPTQIVLFAKANAYS